MTAVSHSGALVYSCGTTVQECTHGTRHSLLHQGAQARFAASIAALNVLRAPHAYAAEN